MFRIVSLSIIRSFSLYVYTQQLQFHPDPVRKLSANLYDIYHCCVYTYSEEILMMDRGTARNM